MIRDAQNPLEEMIASVWTDVLNLPSVGRDENFFALGGHSLTASDVSSRLCDMLGIDLPLSLVFDAPTVAELARTIEAVQQQDQPLRRPPQRIVPRLQNLPLSAIQRSTWFLASLAPNLPLYHMTVVINIHAPVDAAVLERALNEIIRRHEAWRTTFDLVGNERVQIIHDALPISMRHVDLRGVPTLQVDQQAVAEASQPFDLIHGPLLRASLFQLDETTYRLLLTVHHLVCDGYAVTHIFLPELDALYTALLAGQPSPLPEPLLQYADYTTWQDQAFNEDTLKPLVSYWKERLHSLPDLPLPGRKNAVVTFHGARQPIELPVPLGDALKKLSRRANATLFMTLLTAFETLLTYYSKQNDLAVFIPLSGRQYAGLEGIMGVLASAVPVRTRLDGTATFMQAVGRMRQTVQEASAHQGLSLRRLLLMMQAAARGRQGEVLFAFDALSRPLPSHWQVETEIDLGTAKLDLYLHLTERTDGIQGSFEYSTDLFNAQTIRKMSADYLHVLQIAAADPGLSLTEIHQRL